MRKKSLESRIRDLRKQLKTAAAADDLGLVEDLIIEIDESLEQIRVESAREDPNAFIEYVFEDKHCNALKQAPFHRAWQELIGHPEWNPDGYKRGIIIAPRDHGKTTQMVGRVLWELGNNPNLRIKIACQSDSKAMERLFEITDHLERNERVGKVFPHLRPAQRGDWTKHKIVIQRDLFSKDASIEALGIMSTATGGRCDLLVADDIVDRRNAIQFPQIRETIKHAWRSDWTNLLEPDGRIIYICTLWHTADLSHTLIDNLAFATLFYSVSNNFKKLEGWRKNPGTKSKETWTEDLWHHWDEQALKERKEEIGSIEFDRAFRNIALSGEIVVVQPAWITYWKAPPDFNNLITFQGFDLAIGRKAQHDYFASVTVGVDPDSLLIYVLRFYRARLSFTQQANAVINDYLEWEPEEQRIESIQYQESLPQYLDELVGKQIDDDGIPLKRGKTKTGKVRYVPALPIYRAKPRLDKMARLKAATPYLERKQILFDPAMNPEDEAFIKENGDLVSELTTFPLAAHDDVADAFVHAVASATRYLAAIGSDDDEGDELEVGVTTVGV